jgi:hypothetical protein
MRMMTNNYNRMGYSEPCVQRIRVFLFVCFFCEFWIQQGCDYKYDVVCTKNTRPKKPNMSLVPKTGAKDLGQDRKERPD